MKNLILVRHAKSTWDNPEWTDFERQLNIRGNRDAATMSQLIASKGIKPDLLISSPAKRTTETSYYFCDALSYEKKHIRFDLGIYERGSKYIINLLSGISSNVHCIMLVGHNPDITSLASYFSGEYFDNIPTCGIVSIQFTFDSWNNIVSNNGQLVFFEFPKNNLD